MLLEAGYVAVHMLFVMAVSLVKRARYESRKIRRIRNK